MFAIEFTLVNQTEDEAMSGVENLVNSEAEIMKILWRREGRPVTATEIREELKGRSVWKKSTVLTLIRRLVEKGIVACDKKDVFYYTPLVSEDEYRKFQTRSFIDRIYDGSVKNLLTALCRTDSLSRQDVEELAEFLEKEAGHDG
jgi:BlaI family penicillinase repressor